MKPLLTREFEKLEAQRQNLLKTITPHRWERLAHAPPGQWSAIQVLAHLVTAEKMSVAYMSKKMAGIQETTDTGLLEDVRMLALKWSQRLPLKFKAPVAVVEKTPAYPALEALLTDWDAVRQDLKKLLQHIPPALLRRKIYRHPVAGRLNVQHALAFFREHINHHQPQLQRLLAQAAN